MFGLSKAFTALAGRRMVTERISQDFVESCSSNSDDNIDTDDDDDAHDHDKATPPCLPNSSTHIADDCSRADSGVGLENSQQPRGESITKLTSDKCASIDYDAEASEPFPEVDPLLLAIGHVEADGPPDLQGLLLANVENILERLRDTSLSSVPESSAGESSSLELLENDGFALVHAEKDEASALEPIEKDEASTLEFAEGQEATSSILDTSIDFTSVSRSSSLSSFERLNQAQSLPSHPEEQLEAIQITPPTSGEGKRILELMEEQHGPRYQLPGEHIDNYLNRIHARVATITNARNKVNTYSSSSSDSSDDDDLSSFEDGRGDNSDSYPSSPLTPLTPHKCHDLSILQTLDSANRSSPKDPDAAPEWRVSKMVGPPIFDISETRMTPSRKEVYKHIDFWPLDLYHKRLHPKCREVLLERDCLQCVVKNMKCDRFHPCCRRCIRSGDAPYCLHQRRLPRWELKQLGLTEIKYVVLTRLPEDGDELWEEKLRREDALLEVLQERIDRRNWVCPVNTRVTDCYDEFEVRGKELCEERGGTWEYKYVDDDLRIVVDHY